MTGPISAPGVAPGTPVGGYDGMNIPPTPTQQNYRKTESPDIETEEPWEFDAGGRREVGADGQTVGMTGKPPCCPDPPDRSADRQSSGGDYAKTQNSTGAQSEQNTSTDIPVENPFEFSTTGRDVRGADGEKVNFAEKPPCCDPKSGSAASSNTQRPSEGHKQEQHSQKTAAEADGRSSGERETPSTSESSGTTSSTTESARNEAAYKSKPTGEPAAEQKSKSDSSSRDSRRPGEPAAATNKESKSNNEAKDKPSNPADKEQPGAIPRTAHTEPRQSHASVNQVRETSNPPNAQRRETTSVHEATASKGRVELPKGEVSRQRVDISSIGRIGDRRTDSAVAISSANSIPEQRAARSAVERERTAQVTSKNSEGKVQPQDVTRSVRREFVAPSSNPRSAARENATIGGQRSIRDPQKTQTLPGRIATSSSELRVRPSRQSARLSHAASGTASNPRTRGRLQSSSMQPTRTSRTLLREQKTVRSKSLSKEQGHIKDRVRASRQRNNNDSRRQNRNTARDILSRSSGPLRNREIRSRLAPTRPGTTLRLARLRQEKRDGKVKVNHALVRRLNGLFKKHEQLAKTLRVRTNGGLEAKMRVRHVRKSAGQETSLTLKRATALLSRGKIANDAITRTGSRRPQSLPEKSKEIRLALRQIAIKDLPRGKSIKSLPIKVRLEVVRARHRVQALTARLRQSSLPEPLIKRLTSELSTSDLERLVAILAGSRGVRGLKKKRVRGATAVYLEDDISLAVLRDLESEAIIGSNSNSGDGEKVDPLMSEATDVAPDVESTVVAENAFPTKTLDTAIVKDGAAANP